MGSVWQRLGSQVTVVEFMDRIVPEMDSELGTALHKSLIKQGIEFKLSSKVWELRKRQKKLNVNCYHGDTETLEADVVLELLDESLLPKVLGLTKSE